MGELIRKAVRDYKTTLIEKKRRFAEYLSNNRRDTVITVALIIILYNQRDSLLDITIILITALLVNRLARLYIDSINRLEDAIAYFTNNKLDTAITLALVLTIAVYVNKMAELDIEYLNDVEVTVDGYLREYRNKIPSDYKTIDLTSCDRLVESYDRRKKTLEFKLMQADGYRDKKEAERLRERISDLENQQRDCF